MVRDSKEYIRDFLRTSGVKRNKLAKLAGINYRTIYGVFDDSWNPTARTLELLEDAIRAYRLSVE